MLKLHLSVILILVLAGCENPAKVEVDQTNTTQWPAYTQECIRSCKAYKAGEREFPDHCGTNCSEFLDNE